MIAAVVGALVAVVSTIIGAGVFVLSLATIYFRGYLIPGTLTKRYFPEWVLRWFRRDVDSIPPLTDDPTNIDPEQTPLNAGAVELRREGTDLCLPYCIPSSAVRQYH